MTTGKDTAKELDMGVARRTAIILQFPDRLELALSSAPSKIVDGASAEIIIFPGVRIEHWDAGGEGQVTSRRHRSARPVARDMLELLD